MPQGPSSTGTLTGASVRLIVLFRHWYMYLLSISHLVLRSSSQILFIITAITTAVLQPSRSCAHWTVSLNITVFEIYALLQQPQNILFPQDIRYRSDSDTRWACMQQP